MKNNSLTHRIIMLLSLLEKKTLGMRKPLIDEIIDHYGKDPFLILIGCLLSLRARDLVTSEVCKELFTYIRTPQELAKLPLPFLEKLFHPLGFSRTKARTVVSVSRELLIRFEGKVPHTLEELLSIKGIGRKTANLVLGKAFDIPAICVDTHVHRITNRLGWVSTSTPEQTEQELMKIVPQDYWISLNYLLVIWGQNICTPLSPWCSRCVLLPWCPQVAVKKHR